MLDKFFALIEKLLALLAGVLAYRAGATAARAEQQQVMIENDTKAADARRTVGTMDDDAVLARLHERWQRE